MSLGYLWKWRLGYLITNSQSIRWQTQGRILRSAVKEFISKRHSALDVGCGGGTYAIEHLLRRGVKTTLTDFLEEHVSLAREQVSEAGFAENAEFLRCSAEDLPFENARFDFIQCMEVLEHLQNPAKALDEFWRVAAPGARLVVSVPHPPEWFHNPEHVVDGFTEREMRQALEAAGWTVLRVEFCMLILSRLVNALLNFVHVPLPLNPVIRLENLIPHRFRPALLPYDMVLVAEKARSP